MSGSVTGFPVLVRLNTGNFYNFSQTSAGGTDIRFASSGGTHLPYQIERWVDGAGDNDSAWIWVKTDVTGNNSTQYIVMYWGKADASDSSSGDAVFPSSNGYLGAYHLGDATDASSNGNDGTGTALSDAGGIIGKAQSFNGSSSYIHLGDLADRASGSISCWFKPSSTFNSSTGTSQGIYGKCQGESYNATLTLRGTEFLLGDGSAGELQVKMEYNNSSAYVSSSTNSFTGGTWYYVTVTWGGGNNIMYLNGSSQATTGGTQTLAGTQEDEIGRSYYDGGNISGGGPRWFNGVIDEFRLETSARSADWIKLCYQNQRASQTLVEVQSVATDYTWDSSATTGIQAARSGTWGSSGYWTPTGGSGTVLSGWPGAGYGATFAGGDGTYAISVSGTQYVDSITVLNSGYTVSGGTAIDLGTKKGVYVASGKSATFGTKISGIGGLTLTGGGTLTLSGANDYTGATTVSDGTLLVTGSLASGSAVTVASGETLGGTGTVSGTVAANGVISPGTTGYGTLTVGNSLTFSGTGGFTGTIGGTSAGTNYDRVVMSAGTLTLGGAVLTLSLGYAPAASDAYTIIDNAGAGAVSGTFGALAQGSTLSLSYGGAGYDFTISYTGGTGNDVVLTCTGLTPVVSEDYTEWSDCQSVTLNTTPTGADVSGNVFRFPVLVRLDPGTFSFFGGTQPGGADIRFAKTDGTHLHYYIERWLDCEDDLDTAEIWVRLDTVYGSNSVQSFRMYWGKSDAADSSNGAAVFDTGDGFAGVWPLGDDPAGGSGAIRDATINGNDGTSTGSMASGDLVAAQIGKGIDLDGSNDGIDIPDDAAFDITDSVTILAWFKANNLDSWKRIVTKSHTSEADPYTMYGLHLDDGTHLRGELADGSQNLVNGSTALSTGVWYHAAFTYNGATLKLFLNGAQESNTTSHTGDIDANNMEFCIGKSSYDADYFGGVIDNVWLCHTARSADWIKLCYENQKTGQTLVSLEDYSTWGFSGNLTINTSGDTTTSCLGFPLLVRLTSTNFDFNQARDSGQDIRFSKSDGTRLPYQIERWDKAGTVAEIWVKVDTVFGNNASQYIRMHWGKSGVTSRSNGGGVFGTSNRFSGAWHLGEEGNATALDATTAGNHGTVSGFTTSSDVTGAIGIARDFNGSSTGGDYLQINNALLKNALSAGSKKATVSCWVRADATSFAKMIVWEGNSAANGWGGEEEVHLVFGRMNSTATYSNYVNLFVCNATNYENGGNPVDAYYSYSDVSGWHYLTATIDNSTAGAPAATIYIDGVSRHTDAGGFTPNFSNYNTNTRFGRPGADTRYLDGKLDEVSISDTTRSADWIRLCYETQRPNAGVVTCDSADAFRALRLKRYGSLDSVYVGTTNWALRFARSAGGGIKFLAKDTSSANQLDANLFYLVYNGQSSASGTGTLALLDSSTVFARIRQEKSVAGQPFTLDYTVLGSGKLFVRVSATAASALSGGLEFRIATNASSSTNRQFGSPASACSGVMHVDGGLGKYDLILAPFDLWTEADEITSAAKYTGIKSGSWSAPAGKRLVWNFMVDFSHRQLLDSASAYGYVADYRNSDTLGFYAGTPLFEQAWENHEKGQWSFEEGEGSAVADVSGRNHTAAIGGTPRWTGGKWFGYADSLDGSDSVTVAHHTDFDGTTAHTLMAWIKPATALDATTTILSKFSGGGTGYRLTGAADGKLLYTIGGSGGIAELRSASALIPGQWSHVAAEMVLIGLQHTLRLYVNGDLDTMRTGFFESNFGITSEELVIGRSFNGVIDDVRFYNDDLFEEEIKAISLKGFSPDQGMYLLRADNDNTLHCRMHGTVHPRLLPVLQIANYWATALPSYVYVDGALLGTSEYHAALDDSRNRLTVGFNRAISGNSTIYIDDDYQHGNKCVGPTKKMYWGTDVSGAAYCFWVKNTAEASFGAASTNQFYMNWKMGPTGGNDGELWHMRSSVTNPFTTIGTSTGDNLIPGYDAGSGLGDLTFNFSNYIVTSLNVGSAFTYAVEESSLVRVRLRINQRIAKNTDSLCIVSRWTLYPTGQFFRYDSLYGFSGVPQDVFVNVFFDDSLNVTLYKSESKKRGAVVYSQGYPDMVSAWLSMKNAAGFQSEPFDADIITTIYSLQRTGIVHYQAASPPGLWNSSSVQIVHHIDIHHAGMNASSMDSIANGVQCIKFPGRRALSMITGTLDSTTAGDLSDGRSSGGDGGGDGYNEMEGAYILGASGNTVAFVLPAHGDTCRYYPAFRITNYTAVNHPQYLYVYNGSDTTALLEGYQYNCHLNPVSHELVVQIDSVFCDSTKIYLSADKTLAVKMSLFEARPGNRRDTLLWRTESEQENLGYRIERRIEPHFLDSLMAAYAGRECDAPSGSDTAGTMDLIKRRMVTAADTGWVALNRKLLPGAASGISHGPRDYRYIDRNLHNGILYEYRLIAVDYHQGEEVHGPVAAMPRHIAPARFMLGFNYPNPFRASTRIRFALPVETAVSLNIYSLQGRLVRRLVEPDRKLPADDHTVLWDGRNENGGRCAAGPYVYRMNTGKFVKSRVMLLVR